MIGAWAARRRHGSGATSESYKRNDCKATRWNFGGILERQFEVKSEGERSSSEFRGVSSPMRQPSASSLRKYQVTPEFAEAEVSAHQHSCSSPRLLVRRKNRCWSACGGASRRRRQRRCRCARAHARAMYSPAAPLKDAAGCLVRMGSSALMPPSDSHAPLPLAMHRIRRHAPSCCQTSAVVLARRGGGGMRAAHARQSSARHGWTRMHGENQLCVIVCSLRGDCKGLGTSGGPALGKSY